MAMSNINKEVIRKLSKYINDVRGGEFGVDKPVYIKLSLYTMPGYSTMRDIYVAGILNQVAVHNTFLQIVLKKYIIIPEPEPEFNNRTDMNLVIHVGLHDDDFDDIITEFEIDESNDNR